MFLSVFNEYKKNTEKRAKSIVLINLTNFVFLLVAVLDVSVAAVPRRPPSML